MAQRQWRSDDTDKWKYAFGDGSDGSTYSVPSNEGCSGSASGTSLTLASAGSFANGDLVLIHQTAGTGAGNWELNKIASGGGTTSLTMAHNLMNTYTDSGASQAQIIELKQYQDLTISTTVTAPLWDGSKGGIIAFLDKGTTTISGTLTAQGRGFSGGAGVSQNNGYQGESSTGTGSVSRNANGMAGGGGLYGDNTLHAGGGGGGGYGAAGTDGSVSNRTQNRYGYGGSSGGVAGLTTLFFGGGGGAGGGGQQDLTGTGGAGGRGSGIIAIFSKNLTITGTVVNTGGTAGARVGSRAGGGGGGAGGGVIFKCEVATLGTSKVLSSGGTATNGSFAWEEGGPGAVGRIHLDYSGSYTGTTSPTLDATLDSTIKAGNNNFFLFL